MSKFTIADLKAKYAAISTGTWNSEQKLTTTKSGQQIRPPIPKEGSFTETERAILLVRSSTPSTPRASPSKSDTNMG